MTLSPHKKPLHKETINQVGNPYKKTPISLLHQQKVPKSEIKN
jgi:hypothetical protein